MKKLFLSLLLALTASAAMAGDSNFVELLTNGNCDGTFNGWKKVDAGDGWAIGTEEDGSHCWTSSYELCQLWQTIDLKAKGFNTSSIDSGQLKCKVSVQMKPGWEYNTLGASYAGSGLHMLDENGEIIQSLWVMYDLNYADAWQDYEASFYAVSGTRYLKFFVAGRDAIDWAGQFGPSFRNLSIKAGVSDPSQDDRLVLLTHIKSTGFQAFNTGYIHKANTKVVMDCNVVLNHQRNWEALFGGRLGDYHNNAFCFFARTDGKDIPCFNRSGEEPRGTGFVYGERITIVASGTTATWYRHSDPSHAVGSVTTTGTPDEGKTPMLLFNLNTSDTPYGVQKDTSPSIMTLYGCKIYEGDVLVHDFVPAMKSCVVGLYDKVTGSFSGTISDIPFSAGDIYDPCIETGHAWSEWEETVALTCTEDGELCRVCARCGAKETQTIPALGHDWNNKGVCNRCGATTPDFYIYASGYCGRPDVNGGKDVQYTITGIGYNSNNLTITISGTGPMADYQWVNGDTTCPWTTYDGRLTSVVIENGVSHIGNVSFKDFHYIVSASIPISVTDIGESAFYYCEKIEHLVLPARLKTIGRSAFSYCTSLKAIDIPASVETIDFGAFSHCTSLEKITLPDGLKTIGMWAFSWCPIETITFGSALEHIGDDAFYDCTSVTDIYCYADPSKLFWAYNMSDFKPDKATKCHVRDVSAWSYFFNRENVTFVGDLDDYDAIKDIAPSPSEGSDAWYTLDGVKFSGKPTKPGIYITGGRKVTR